MHRVIVYWINAGRASWQSDRPPDCPGWTVPFVEGSFQDRDERPGKLGVLRCSHLLNALIIAVNINTQTIRAGQRRRFTLSMNIDTTRNRSPQYERGQGYEQEASETDLLSSWDRVANSRSS